SPWAVSMTCSPAPRMAGASSRARGSRSSTPFPSPPAAVPRGQPPRPRSRNLRTQEPPMTTPEVAFSPLRRQTLRAALAASVGALGLAAVPAHAATDLVVGTILPLSGAFADQGGHYETGMRMYLEQHGATV